MSSKNISWVWYYNNNIYVIPYLNGIEPLDKNVLTEDPNLFCNSYIVNPDGTIMSLTVPTLEYLNGYYAFKMTKPVALNVGDNVSSDVVESIKSALADKIPVYYRVYLGYISGGVFIRFSNGQIN